MLEERRWLWVLVGFVGAPALLVLYNWIHSTVEAPFATYSWGSETTEILAPGAASFVPGPKLAAPCFDPKVRRLEDGSVLVIEDEQPERLDPTGSRFTLTGRLPENMHHENWLLPASGGAVLVGKDGDLLRYRFSDNAWEPLRLRGEGVPREPRVYCADMIAPTILLAVLSQRTSEDWVTQVALFDIDANQPLAVVDAPFVTLRCAVGAGLLVGKHLGQNTVRAAVVKLSSRSRVEVVPLPGLAGMFRLPEQIIPVTQGTYRLFPSRLGESVIQQWDSRQDKIDQIELKPSSVPKDSTRTPLDAHKILIAGGQRKTVNDGQNFSATDIVDDIFRFDVDTGRLERLPFLLVPRLHPFAVQLADGRVMVGGGREGGRRILWRAVAECAGAFLSALFGLAILLLLAIKVPPQPGTLVLALLAAAIALTLGGYYVFTQVRIGD